MQSCLLNNSSLTNFVKLKCFDHIFFKLIWFYENFVKLSFFEENFYAVIWLEFHWTGVIWWNCPQPFYLTGWKLLKSGCRNLLFCLSRSILDQFSKFFSPLKAYDNFHFCALASTPPNMAKTPIFRGLPYPLQVDPSRFFFTFPLDICLLGTSEIVSIFFKSKPKMIRRISNFTFLTQIFVNLHSISNSFVRCHLNCSFSGHHNTLNVNCKSQSEKKNTNEC